MTEAKSKKSKSGEAASEGKKQTASNKRQTKETSSTDWAQTVLNNLVEAQKTWFEITSQQNALLIETVAKVTELRQNAPTNALSNWAKQGVEGFVEAQKRWSEITVQQSEQILKSVQSNANFSGSEQKSPSKGTNQSVEDLAKMRAAWLDFVAQQNNQIVNIMKESLKIDDSSPAAALADFAQKAVNNYIEVQKRWLDLAMQLPFLDATNQEK